MNATKTFDISKQLVMDAYKTDRFIENVQSNFERVDGVLREIQSIWNAACLQTLQQYAESLGYAKVQTAERAQDPSRTSH